MSFAVHGTLISVHEVVPVSVTSRVDKLLASSGSIVEVETRFHLQTVSLLQRLVADRVDVRGRPKSSLPRQSDDADGSAVVDTVLTDEPVVFVAVTARIEELLTVFTDLIVIEAPETRCTCTSRFGLRANGFFARVVSSEGSDALGRTDRLANFRILEIVCISLTSRPEELVTIFALCTVVVATDPRGT